MYLQVKHYYFLRKGKYILEILSYQSILTKMEAINPLRNLSGYATINETMWTNLEKVRQKKYCDFGKNVLSLFMRDV